MTIHIHREDIKCQKCSTIFIPFYRDFRCPNCNEPTEEFFDFIPAMVDAMKHHKQKYGKLMPDAWYVGSFSEHVQSIVFKIFDALEMANPTDPQMSICDFINKKNEREEQ